MSAIGESIGGSEDALSGELAGARAVSSVRGNARRLRWPKQQSPCQRSRQTAHKMKEKPPAAIPIKASSPMGEVFATGRPCFGDDFALTPAFAADDINDIARVFGAGWDKFRS
jgi:hypothetical protein